MKISPINPQFSIKKKKSWKHVETHIEIKLHCVNSTYSRIKWLMDEYGNTLYWFEPYISFYLKVYILDISSKTSWFWKKKQESFLCVWFTECVELNNFYDFSINSRRQIILMGRYMVQNVYLHNKYLHACSVYTYMYNYLCVDGVNEWMVTKIELKPCTKNTGGTPQKKS